MAADTTLLWTPMAGAPWMLVLIIVLGLIGGWMIFGVLLANLVSILRSHRSPGPGGPREFSPSLVHEVGRLGAAMSLVTWAVGQTVSHAYETASSRTSLNLSGTSLDGWTVAAHWILAVTFPVFLWVWQGMDHAEDPRANRDRGSVTDGLATRGARRLAIRLWWSEQTHTLTSCFLLGTWVSVTTVSWTFDAARRHTLATRLGWCALLLGVGWIAFHHGHSLVAGWRRGPSFGWMRWAVGFPLGAREADQVVRAMVEQLEAEPSDRGALDAAADWAEEILLRPGPAPRLFLRYVLRHPDREVRLRVTQLVGRRADQDGRQAPPRESA